ncbi:MAG: hypothetical protein QNJ71_01545 [Acidimicrobiia bacterium]|nr:hypothetical protein [Acidimicrobiia bacterium]
MTIVWHGITPQIGEELSVTPGVGVSVVGSYLWIQYVTGEPSSTANVQSVKIAPGTSEMTVCTPLHDSEGPDIPTGPDAPVEAVEVEEPGADDDDGDEDGQFENSGVRHEDDDDGDDEDEGRHEDDDDEDADDGDEGRHEDDDDDEDEGRDEDDDDDDEEPQWRATIVFLTHEWDLVERWVNHQGFILV